MTCFLDAIAVIKDNMILLSLNRKRRNKCPPVAVILMANPMRSCAIPLEFPGVYNVADDVAKSWT